MGRNLTNLYISQSFQFLTQVSGSELQDGLGNKITGSLEITASLANTATTASYVLNAVSASFATNAISSSFATTAISSSFSNTATSASYANTAGTSDVSTEVVVVTDNTNSTRYVSFTDTLSGTDSQRVDTGLTYTPFTNTLSTTNINATTFTGDLIGTASFATNVISASFATSASQAQNAISASFATSASQAQNAISASFASTSNTTTSSSFATTASLSLNNVLTSSTTNDTITFTKGNGTTYTNVINNVSASISSSFATTAASATSASFATTAASATSASYAVSASQAQNAVTASFALNVTPINTGSFLVTASISNATTTYTKADGSTFALTTNNVVNANSASVATSASYALSASFATNALSASYAPAGNPFPYTGSAQITGSLGITGSFSAATGSTIILNRLGVNISSQTGSELTTNVTIGPGAGINLTTGRRNVLLGGNSFGDNEATGYSLTTGQQNIFIGANAGHRLTDCEDNIIIGTNNGRDGFASGNRNTLVGSGAGQSLGNGSERNSYFGQWAGYVSAGNDNILLGQAAGFNLGSSNRNTIIGVQLQGQSAGTFNSSSYLAIGGYNTHASESLLFGHYGTDVPRFLNIKGNTDISGSLTMKQGLGNVLFPYNTTNNTITFSSNGAIVGGGGAVGGANINARAGDVILGGYGGNTFTMDGGGNHMLTSRGQMTGFGVFNYLFGGDSNRITPFAGGGYGQGIVGGNNNVISGIQGGSHIFGSQYSTVNGSNAGSDDPQAVIIGGNNHTINNGRGSIILGGIANTISQSVGSASGSYAAILASSGSTIGNFTGTVILGGANITASANNTIYTPDLRTLGTKIILGSTTNAISNGSGYLGIYGGQDNTINNGTTATIVGGQNNTINQGGASPSIIGSRGSTITTGDTIGIFGGQGHNMANGYNSFFFGGRENTINTGTNNFLGGGHIFGGYGCQLQGNGIGVSEIFGGISNIIQTTSSMSGSIIIGGASNRIDDINNAVVIGGNSINATRANTVHLADTIVSGSLRMRVTSSVNVSTTASLDFSKSNYFTLNTDNNLNTYINPINVLPGQTVELELTFPTTASAITFPSFVKQPSGSAYSPSGANTTDILTFKVFSNTGSVYLTSVKNFV